MKAYQNVHENLLIFKLKSKIYYKEIKYFKLTSINI